MAIQVAIIGGGIVGSSAAYHLLRRGARVCLFDRADDGRATAAGAGILPALDHFSGNQALLPLLKAARQHYVELTQALARDGGPDTGYDVVGALHVAQNETELEQLRGMARECESRKRSGFLHIGEVDEIDAAEARRLFPPLNPRLLGALHTRGAARVDGRKLLAALRRAALRLGLRLMQGGAELELVAGRVRGVRAGSEVFEADVVVVAAGAWSVACAKQLGLQLPLRPQRGQILHFDLPGQATASWPMVLGIHTNYLLTFPAERVVAGATREDAAGYDPRITAAGVFALLENALRLAPGLAAATLKEMRVGLRPVTVDGKPILGSAPEHPNVLFATGHGGYGLEAGPYSGELVAELALARDISLDVRPFAPNRRSW